MKIFCQPNNDWNLSSLLICVHEKRKISRDVNFSPRKNFTNARKRKKIFQHHRTFSTQLSDNRWTIGFFPTGKTLFTSVENSCSHSDFPLREKRSVFKNGTELFGEWLKLSEISLDTNTTCSHFIVQLRLYLDVVVDDEIVVCKLPSNSFCLLCYALAMHSSPTRIFLHNFHRPTVMPYLFIYSCVCICSHILSACLFTISSSSFRINVTRLDIIQLSYPRVLYAYVSGLFFAFFLKSTRRRVFRFITQWWGDGRGKNSFGELCWE